MVWPHYFLYCPADGAGVFPDAGILTRFVPWASRTSKIQKRVPGEDVQSSGSHSFDHCQVKSVTFYKTVKSIIRFSYLFIYINKQIGFAQPQLQRDSPICCQFCGSRAWPPLDPVYAETREVRLLTMDVADTNYYCFNSYNFFEFMAV